MDNIDLNEEQKKLIEMYCQEYDCDMEGFIKQAINEKLTKYKYSYDNLHVKEDIKPIEPEPQKSEDPVNMRDKKQNIRQPFNKKDVLKTNRSVRRDNNIYGD